MKEQPLGCSFFVRLGFSIALIKSDYYYRLQSMLFVIDIKIVSLATNIRMHIWYTNQYKVLYYA